MPTSLLAGRHILLVEDDFFVAHDLAMSLKAAQAVVIGPVASVASGRTLIAQTDRLDGAIMDVNLGQELSYELVDLLEARAVPVAFASGYDRAVIPKRYAHVPLCEKPINLMRCAAAMFG